MVDEPVTIHIAADADIVSARELGRRVAESLGFSATDATLIATAISEVARNIMTYAGNGEIEVVALREPRRVGIEVVARDRGPGIADLDRALQDGFSSSRGTGLGLPGTRRLMDEFSVIAPVGNGTTVTMRRWMARPDS